MTQRKNLWDLALQKVKDGSNESSNEEVSHHSYMLVCGSKECGKTSLIQRFQDRDETPKPTFALDFCYVRKTKQHNMSVVKDISHVWELGGGTTMIDLLNVAITPKNIRNLSVVLVLDISKPNSLWNDQEVLLSHLKQKINSVLKEAALKDRNIVKELQAKAWSRVGEDHPDKKMITPFIVPLAIIGAKYDEFIQNIGNDQKEMIVKTIRFLAHSNGAVLQFFSNTAEGLNAKTKSLLSHLAFNTSLNKQVVLDKTKPLIVPFGQDSFEQIGPPPVSTDILMRTRGDSPNDVWKTAYLLTFPLQNEIDNQKVNPTLNKQFAEKIVDEMRQQKDAELERYRRLSQRKLKEAEIKVDTKIKKAKGKERKK